MSASSVGRSLIPAWAAQAGKVPHRITSKKDLEHQKFYTRNSVWDLPCLGSPSRHQAASNPKN